MPENRIYFNGIDATTGRYRIPPIQLDDLARRVLRPPATGSEPPPEEIRARSATRKLMARYNPDDLKQAGWGVLFHTDESSEIRAALDPLIQQRGGRVLEYRSGETKDLWMARHGAGPGALDPKRIPYYILIVGEPERIPFRFQYSLSLPCAVGRICFDDPEGYESYVRSVLAYDAQAAIPNKKEVALFATRHEGDPATELSLQHLATPLASSLKKDGVSTRLFLGEAAGKSSLASLLQSREPPAIVFTAGHGLSLPNGNPNQRAAQGALVCQDWVPGQLVEAEHYFAAADVGAGARLQGMVFLTFACFSAGTPRLDEFLRGPEGGPLELAAGDFVSSLPRRLLSHPEGGALALIGHVGQAWGYSFEWGEAGEQINTFVDVLDRLLLGQRLGHATEAFDDRYAEIAEELSNLYADRDQDGKEIPPEELVGWTVARNDSRNYIVLGDPAVRLRPELLR